MSTCASDLMVSGFAALRARRGQSIATTPVSTPLTGHVTGHVTAHIPAPALAAFQPHAGPAYAGIGSRSTPPDVLALMEELGQTLATAGYALRSGAAQGADQAFENGCDAVRGPKSIFLPWSGFQQRRPDALTTYVLEWGGAAFEMAATVHPAWNFLGRGPKALHARNCCQVFGLALDTPAAFVLAWTADGAQTAAETSRATGGTGTAIRLASASGIQVVNIARDGWADALNQLLQQAVPVASPVPTGG